VTTQATRGGEALAPVLRAAGPEVARLMVRLEHRMLELSAGHGEALERHARTTIAAGGKRLRPLLVCVSAGVPAPQSDALLECAVAVELLHAATLVHDDVLDGASLRRGHPTVVARGGRLAATATGDLLFSRAFAALAATGSVTAVRILARAGAELAAGELMQRADAFSRQVGRQRYYERCRLKTAVLFRAACELGALHGDGPREELGAFGESIGLAFQILDDVLDVSGPPERTGKPRGADLLDGTVTLPLILARERDRELARLDPRAITSASAAHEVCERIEATGALELAREDARQLVEAAKARLPPLLGERQREALELIADGVLVRYS
jgi:geranylgeranyl pyrophosphate synthase